MHYAHMAFMDDAMIKCPRTYTEALAFVLSYAPMRMPF